MMKKQKTPPPSTKTVGKISDYYDKEGVYYKDKADGQLYVGVKNRAVGIVTIVAKMTYDGARHETVTILKSPKRYEL